MLTGSLLCFITLEALWGFAAPNNAMGEPGEVKARNFGLHPSILGELAYSVNRFVFVSSKENC